jgi:hypothetical protein
MSCNRKFHDLARKTYPSAVLLAGIVWALCLPYQAVAQGGFTGPGQYEITNVKSGKVLDLDRNNQTSVIQFSSRGTNNQAWSVQSAGGSFYSLRNVMNGAALEAVGTDDSTPVRATRFSGASNQQWRFDTGKDGNALIVSRLGKTLDIPGGTDSDGARVQTYKVNGDSNQRFMFRSVSGTVGASSGRDVIPNSGTITCSSDNGKRNYCTADTRSGVRLVRQISGSPCQEGSTWGYDSRGIWVDRGCRAEFAVSGGSGGNVTTNPGAARTELNPGWNMFSPQQDVELGQQASGEVAGQVLLLNDSRVDKYLNNIGQRLSAQTPGFEFPYTYKAVNDRGINAFALPGGHIYINRGVIEAADNEAQLAGVMAHEASHIALRHGTNQASKASIAQMPLAILGGLLGSNSTGAALAQLGAGFTVNSILLKYSRDAESQADLMGTQILYDAGYDPRAMGQFFGKIQGGNGIAFFSDHPNPDRRIETVNEEVAKLGGTQRISRSDPKGFDQIKRYVQSLPAPRPNQLQSQQQQAAPGQPAQTSERFSTFENSMLRINYPDSWQAFGQGDAVTMAPQGGMVNDGNGNQALAFGVLANIYEPHSARYGQQLQGPGFEQGAGMPAEQATDQLIATLQQSNRNMRVVRRQGSIDVNGQRGLSTYLSNDSPMQGGGRETNWLVTLPRPEGLLFLVFIAPEREFQGYENTFQQMLYSVRTTR